jgi:hypothetical protein
MREIVRCAERGVAVPGFATASRSSGRGRLLPGALICNVGLGFVCRFVELTPWTRTSPFTVATQ